jgi:hypothetical protein
MKGAKTMKWVTRARPKVDRIACPWLIKRFVDGEAEFLYVAPDKVMEIAKHAFSQTPLGKRGSPIGEQPVFCNMGSC